MSDKWQRLSRLRPKRPAHNYCIPQKQKNVNIFFKNFSEIVMKNENMENLSDDILAFNEILDDLCYKAEFDEKIAAVLK